MVRRRTDAEAIKVDEQALHSFYRDVRRHKPLKPQEHGEYFAQLREAEKQLWMTILWHTPTLFAYWDTRLGQIPDTSYTEIVTPEIRQEMVSLFGSYKQHYHHWTAIEEQRANTIVMQLAEALIYADVAHTLRDLVLEAVTKEDIRKEIGYRQAVLQHVDEVQCWQHAIFVGNMRLALKAGNDYYNKTHLSVKLWKSDVLQDACYGLLEAIDRYNPAFGVAFATYAQYWILNRIQRGRTAMESVVYHPARIATTKRRIRLIGQKYLQQYNRLPTTEELVVEDERLTPEIIENLKSYAQKPSFSLNHRILAGGSEDDVHNYQDLVVDTLPSMEEMKQHDQIIEQLYHLLDQVLQEHERHVLVEYFGLQTGVARTLKEIGVTDFHVSKERIRQIKDRALDKLRLAFQEDLGLAKHDCLASLAQLENHRCRGAAHMLVGDRSTLEVNT